MNFRNFLVGVMIAVASISSFAQKAGTNCLLQGGNYVMDFGRYTGSANGTINNIPVLTNPKPGDVFQMAMTTTLCAPVGNAFTLQADGTILINTDGFYKFYFNVDGPGQGGAKRGSANPNGFDIDLRARSIGVMPVGYALTGNLVGGQLDIQKTVYNRLASNDISASDTPVVSRGQAAFPGATISAQQGTYYDVTLPDAGLIVPGDQASASLTSMTDALMGITNNNAVQISARVIANDTVRVFFDVLRSSGSVTIPAGTLNVMAQSTFNARGQVADGWVVTQTPMVLLKAGQTVFFTWKVTATSNGNADYAQMSDMTWAQVEFYGPASVGSTAGKTTGAMTTLSSKRR